MVAYKSKRHYENGKFVHVTNNHALETSTGRGSKAPRSLDLGAR
jgi:hypothetical protein